MDTNSIFLDTCVINKLIERGISPESFIATLEDKHLVVSSYVTRELARTIITPNPKKTFELFSYVKALNPKYSHHQCELYALEIRKLRLGHPVNPFLCMEKEASMRQRVDDLSNGIIDPAIKKYFEVEKFSLKNFRKNWTQGKCEKYKEYKNDFNSLRNAFFKDFKTDQYKINFVRELIQCATMSEYVLNDNEIIKLIENMTEYPALRTLLYSNLYLNFLTEINPDTPAEDRFTDATVLKEASYFTNFLSADYKLIYKHAKYINPYINEIYLDTHLEQKKAIEKI